MQTLDRKNPTKLSSQTRKIATGAILLFALSGLISGFAVGAFVHLKPATGTTHNTGSGTVPIAQNTRTATVATQPDPVRFDYPKIDQVASFEKADGSTFYTFSAHINVAVRASDLTCKLWLIPRVPPGDIIVYPPVDILKDVNNLSNPITSDAAHHNYDIIPGITFPEIQDLNFDPSTPQTQPCTTYQQVTWKYQVSTTAQPGNYDLVVLFDWQGKHYNWSWVNIEIKKAS